MPVTVMVADPGPSGVTVKKPAVAVVVTVTTAALV
jgi:hypothetical protein